MKKIKSAFYKNVTISIAGETVKFANGEAQVKDETLEFIRNSHFPNIAEDGEKIEAPRTAEKKDADETIEVLKEEFNAEIDRLQGIIKEKNVQIGKLENSVETWKNLVSEMQKGKEITMPKEEPKETGLTEEELKAAEAEVRIDLEKLSWEELQNTALGAGMGKTKLKAYKEDKKGDLIEAIITLSKK